MKREAFDELTDLLQAYMETVGDSVRAYALVILPEESGGEEPVMHAAFGSLNRSAAHRRALAMALSLLSEQIEEHADESADLN